jgi:uncharacterized protein (DUF885 family)
VTHTVKSTDLVDSFLAWYFERNPTTASALGAPEHDHTLGDFSASAFAAREAEAQQWLDQFTAADVASLDPQCAVDHDLIVAVLRGEQAMAGWPVWRRDPSAYIGPVLTSFFTAFLHRLRPESELVTAALARLREVPDVLRACRDNLDAELSSPLLVRRALQQAHTAGGFLVNSLPAEICDPDLRSTFAEAAQPAARAFDDLAEFLTDFAEGARGDWRMGEALYSRLLRERELLGYGAGELHRRGEAAYTALEEQMRERAQRVPDGSADWRAVMARLQEDHPMTPEEMRVEYEAETKRAREFVLEHQLVTLAEGEECRVAPSPSFYRPVLGVAFYVAPPPLTPSRVGHFFVPYPPEGFSQEQVRQRLRTNARAQLPTVAVHEAYPGHHWHLSWMAGNQRTVRKVFRTPYFAEGWALYAENLLREHGYFADPAHELAHLEARIFRAARIVVDTALHCGDMTIEQAEQFMTTKSSLTPGTAAVEVNRYCAWPTQASSYLTGCLEIERIREDYVSQADEPDLRTFHDTLAGSGALPLGLARRVVLDQ